ncbi:MAG: hypothetical protein EOP49_00085 [Sphingobacteriales bacterium]|nr:MAG: hypothetical protein EOP49_00085 [Sphingobacteriales bacterium]
MDKLSILTGALVISLLHALIPNHWLPVLAIGRKEGWTLGETSRTTFMAGLAHVASTVVVGFLLGIIGKELADHVEDFTHIVAPVALILIGFYFIRQHYRHRHFHVDGEQLQKRSRGSILAALLIAMFLSPCMEIEAYFLLAGKYGWDFLVMIALLYAAITLAGMLIWVRIVYKGLLKLNWHRWEHNAGIITGCTLIGTGILTYFIG